MNKNIVATLGLLTPPPKPVKRDANSAAQVLTCCFSTKVLALLVKKYLRTVQKYEY
jgi:hypothetical protein